MYMDITHTRNNKCITEIVDFYPCKMWWEFVISSSYLSIFTHQICAILSISTFCSIYNFSEAVQTSDKIKLSDNFEVV